MWWYRWTRRYIFPNSFSSFSYCIHFSLSCAKHVYCKQENGTDDSFHQVKIESIFLNQNLAYLFFLALEIFGSLCSIQSHFSVVRLASYVHPCAYFSLLLTIYSIDEICASCLLWCCMSSTGTVPLTNCLFVYFQQTFTRVDEMSAVFKQPANKEERLKALQVHCHLSSFC